MAKSCGIVRNIVALVTSLAFFAAPALAAERLVIPFEITELGHMQVSFEINGQNSATGVIDTAATFPMIGRLTAKAIGVLDPGADPEMVSVLGLTGTRLCPVVWIDRIMVGNVSKTDMAVALNTDFNVMGTQNVLPSSAFVGDVIDFDFKNERIMVYDGQPDRMVHVKTSKQNLDMVDGLLFAEISINGQKGRALIDTGSSVTYINSRFAEAANTSANKQKTKTLQGATGGNQSIRIASARQLMLGDYRVTRVDILVADPPLFDHLGLEDEPAMVLGLDVLSVFRVQIDRRQGHLVLSIPEKNRSMSSVSSYSPVSTFKRE